MLLWNNRIVGYCNQLDIFVDEQNGFRKERSCEDHIFVLNSIIRNRLNNQKATYGSYIDLEKAFDWINRDMLLYKLFLYDIDGKMYFAIKSLLSNTSSAVMLNADVQTSWFDTCFGVRQGDSLSPTLFSLFLNDLVIHLKESCPTVKVGDTSLNCLLYADDMVLIAESENELQLLLNELFRWCFKWRLKVNEGKSKIVHFRKKTEPVTIHEFTYGDQVLEKVSKYKYLGIIMDEHLKYDCCSKALADSGGRALGAIISKFKSLKNVGYCTFENMFNSGVKPILEYGSGIWGHIEAPTINAIQNRAMRFYLGVHKLSPNLALTGDMGWLSPKLSRYVTRIRLWNRLLKMNENRLTRKIFEWDYGLCKNNWSSEMKKMFENLQSNIFRQKEVFDDTNVGEALHAIMNESWKQDVIKKPKLRTFLLYKEDISREDYVIRINSRSERSLFSQFRHGILPLKIETGRFKGLAIDARLCELCNLNCIEDEIHFLCTCPVYTEVRSILFDKIIDNDSFTDMDCTDKFIFLMKNHWKDVSTFVSNAWRIRQEKLYK